MTEKNNVSIPNKDKCRIMVTTASHNSFTGGISKKEANKINNKPKIGDAMANTNTTEKKGLNWNAISVIGAIFASLVALFAVFFGPRVAVDASRADSNNQTIIETKARLDSLDKNFSEFKQEIKPKLDVMVTKDDLEKSTMELKDLIKSKK